MATLTIRNLDDSVKTGLRLRAAARNRSVEEEVRQILSRAVQESTAEVTDLGARIRSRFSAFGDVRLPIAVREPIRPPPAIEEPSDDTATAATKTRARRLRRR